MAIKYPLVLYGTSIQEIRSGDAIDPSLLGSSYIVTPGTGMISDSAGISIRNISAGDPTVGAIRYNGMTVTAGQFDGSATMPVNTNRLNYNGYLYATRFYGDGSNLTNLPPTMTAGSGIRVTGKVIDNDGVISINGMKGTVTINAGTGISVSGSTITNTGVVSINGKTGNTITLAPSDIGAAPVYTAGTGISISGNSISNTGVTSVNGKTGSITLVPSDIGAAPVYTAGTGISISGNRISGAYTAGTGISISGDVISATGSAGVSSLSVSGTSGTTSAGIVYLQGSGGTTISRSGNTITIDSATTTGTTGVVSLNGGFGAMTLVGSGGTTISRSGTTITINSDTGGGTSGVTSLNGGVGSITLVGGSGTTISRSGTTITISAASGSGGVTSVNGYTGAVTLTAGSGISISGTTISATGASGGGTSYPYNTSGGIMLNTSNTSSGTKLTVGATAHPSSYWNSYFKAQSSHPAIVAHTIGDSSTCYSAVSTTYSIDFLGCYVNTNMSTQGKLGSIIPYRHSPYADYSIGLYSETGRTVYSAFKEPGTGNTYPIIVNTAGGGQVGLKLITDGVTTHSFSKSSFAPGADNNCILGTPITRFSTIYAATGTIQTSDARSKYDVADSTLGLQFIKQLRPVSYKYKAGTSFDKRLVDATAEEKQAGTEYTIEIEVPDGAVGRKFVPQKMIKGTLLGKRTHFGLISQEVKKVLGDQDFAGWTIADKDDPESDQGLRYDQFIAPLIKAVQELTAKVEELEAKLKQQP